MTERTMQQPILSQIDAAQGGGPAPLAAACALFEALNRAGIRYCQWKSSVRLAESLAGRTDFDLLVHRADVAAFRDILAGHGARPLVSASGRAYPGLEHYLGFDAASGRLFHLHVHYRLVLGEQFVKNYRLPLEAQFFEHTRLQDSVRVPLAELELAVLSLRALLKYRDRDVIKDVLGIRSPGLPRAIRDEIAYLHAQTTAPRLAEVLAGLAPVVPPEVVQGFLQASLSPTREGLRLFRLRRQVRAVLRPYQRASRLSATRDYLRELRRRRGTPRRMTPGSGGLEVALLGADGAGKSTMSRRLAAWLAWKLDARLHYLGSKQPSARSRALYVMFRAARRAGGLGGLQGVFLALHDLSIGHDRLARYRAGRRQAASGAVVIYDRFPLRAPLDGPRIDANRRRLAQAEQRVYRQFRLPDVVFALHVEPGEAHRRKPDHARATIEAKSRALAALAAEIERDAPNTTVIHIDAGRAEADVLGQLKTALWGML